jgi:hypothetical protein
MPLKLPAPLAGTALQDVPKGALASAAEVEGAAAALVDAAAAAAVVLLDAAVFVPDELLHAARPAARATDAVRTAADRTARTDRTDRGDRTRRVGRDEDMDSSLTTERETLGYTGYS